MKNLLITFLILLALPIVGKAQHRDSYAPFHEDNFFTGKVRVKDSLGVDGTFRVTGTTVHSAKVTVTGGTLTDSARLTSTLSLPNIVCYVDSFTTTATEDTVTIAGASATDIYIVSMKWNAGVDQQDVLEWEALSGKLVVHRLAAGESGGKYSYIRIKKW